MKNSLVIKLLEDVVRLSECVKMALTVQMNTADCAVVSQNKKAKTQYIK